MIHASFFNAKFQVFHRCLLNQEKKFRFIQAHFCATRCDFKLVRFDSNSLTMLDSLRITLGKSQLRVTCLATRGFDKVAVVSDSTEFKGSVLKRAV